MERKDRLEIDLTDLFFWIKRFWYVFLLFTVIGCVLGGSLAAYMNNVTDTADKSTQISSVKTLLTSKEIKDVEDIVDKLDLAKRKTDELTAEMSNSSHSGDALEDTIKLAEYWNNMYNQQRAVANNLDKNAHKYFELLTADPEKLPDHESVVKFAVIGGAVLFILTGLCLCAVYGMSSTVKTPGELFSMYKIPVLKDLSGKDSNDPMLTTDVSILMNNASLKKLAILYDAADGNEKKVAEKFIEAIEKKSSDISAYIVDPLSSPEELKKLSGCDSVVALVTIKKTRRPSLFEALSYCDRYGCNILGFVTLG